MLKIKNLKVETTDKETDKEILKGVTLNISPKTINVLMGKNGSGKSTLAHTIAGSPFYKVISGEILFEGESILNLKPEERAQKGIFLSFQAPYVLEGVSVLSYLRLIYNKKHSQVLSPVKFREYLKDKLGLVGLDSSFTARYLNDGFSGGEKKKMEMLQMLVLEPKLAILDEIDSGLDVDALKIVAGAVNYLHEKTGMAALFITHYSRILKYVHPEKVFIMKDGLIEQEGGKELVYEIENNGYGTK